MEIVKGMNIQIDKYNEAHKNSNTETPPLPHVQIHPSMNKIWIPPTGEMSDEFVTIDGVKHYFKKEAATDLTENATWNNSAETNTTSETIETEILPENEE